MKEKITPEEQKEIEHIAWGKYVDTGKEPEKQKEKKGEGKLEKFQEKVTAFGEKWNKATDGLWWNPEKFDIGLPEANTDISKQLFSKDNENPLDLDLGLDKIDLGI